MMPLARRSLLGALVLIATALPVLAQMGRVTGRVTDEQGKPLKGVGVKLTNPATGMNRTAKTDAKGRWAALGLDGGTWEVDFELKGYVPRMISMPVGSGPSKPIEIQLEPAGPPPKVLEAAEKGDAAYKAGRFAEARAYYEELLAARPDLAAALHLQIARCYKEEGNYEKELEHLEALLVVDPDNKEVRTLLAMEALEAGQTERALELLKAVDESAIQNPDVFYNIGVVFLNRDRRQDAISYFTKAVALDPGYVDGYLQRGLVYFGLENFTEAEADFRKVHELEPEGPRAETARKVLDSLAQRQ